MNPSREETLYFAAAGVVSEVKVKRLDAGKQRHLRPREAHSSVRQRRLAPAHLHTLRDFAAPRTW